MRNSLSLSFFLNICILLIPFTEIKSQYHQIDTFLQHQIATYKIPALSVALIENGKVIYLKTYGKANIEYNIKNTPNTSFQLASTTKLLTATAFMTLVQEGKLQLDDKVKKFLPELPGSWDDLRIIDLLAHQSGIVDLLGLKIDFKNDKEALDTAVARPLDFAPGTKTVYAGGDYAVVMQLIEKLSGMPFQQFLSERLLDKLGMKHTRFNNMEQDFIYRTYDTIPFAATVYKWDSTRHQQRIFSMMFPQWTYPAGGIFSSINDLAKWAIALDKNTLLQPEFAEKMWTAAQLRNGQTAPFGVGWIVDKFKDEKATGHSGGPALSDIVRLPGRKLTAIVLTNQLELRPFLTMQVVRLYLDNKKI
ncbi:beta-lactamase family protein [Chitinophagaceae bacterium LB-8]|uniref:Beta-lactamase family protein n=1 Tax=Paraflavisolibacter caeni TaxID=2982496 RepID=A0A9X2Y1E3_9BACT|nr:serine hydrolase [Paraflavisolibacter caeni]MCU7551448.1 beta-lactamase family protein [Paraflavisolibacter caeni]